MSVRTESGMFSDRNLRASLTRILRRNVLASFATVSPDGRAHINTAYYAWAEDWSLVFFSYPDSRHARNLEVNSSMAVTVFDSHQRWGKPDQGIQLFGRCRRPGRTSAILAERVYTARFPGFERWRTRLGKEEGSFALVPFRFRPTRAKILDEPKLGGGRFVEVRIPFSPRRRVAGRSHLAVRGVDKGRRRTRGSSERTRPTRADRRMI